jgi:hypothetical protein
VGGARPLLLSDVDLVAYWYEKIENRFGGMSKVEKAETRARVLRKLIEKAMALQKKPHQQHERYLVHWLSPGTPFSSDFMQAEGAADTSKGCSTVVPTDLKSGRKIMQRKAKTS